MEQIVRSATQETWGYLHPCRYVLNDRDTKFCSSFRSVLAGSGVKTIPLPARSPNLNAFAERWVRSAKEECLSKLILFGEGPLSRTLAEFSAHYHGERNHQGKVTNCCSRRLSMNPNNAATPLRVVTGSEVYSSTMAAPHEFLDLTGLTDSVGSTTVCGNLPTAGQRPGCATTSSSIE
jgi:hypothetical protein